MTPPSESSSGHIDMFRVRQQPPELPDRSLAPAAYVVPRHRRYHSVQLALVTGLFACGGLICSMLLVDSNEDFLRLHYWPRKSYSSPAPGTPQNPRSEEHTSELQSLRHLVCRLLLEKKKYKE